MKKSKIKSFTYDTKEDVKKVKINFLKKDLGQYLDLIIEKSKNSRILVILNSVKRSQSLWMMLLEREKEISNKIEIGLLHSKFIQSKRKEIEDKWLDNYGKDAKKRKVNCILVGSQVLQESLDIDSCCLFTDLCPIDMLIQRSGRLWRFLLERSLSKPEVYIFTPGDITKKTWKANVKDFGWTGIVPFVYDDYYLLKTYYTIKNRKNITPSKDLRILLERVYDNREKDPKWFKSFFDKMIKKLGEEKDDALLQLSKSNMITDEICFMNDDMEIETDNRRPTTRRVNQATSKFVLLNKIKEADGIFSLFFLNGESIIINEEDFKNKNDKYRISQIKKDIWRKSSKNSVNIALNGFEDNFEVLNQLKESYRDTILDDFFGNFLFLLIVDENRELTDIDGKSVQCKFKYANDIGLYK